MMSSTKKAVILSGLFTLCAVLTISTICTGGDATPKKIVLQRPIVTFDHQSHIDREDAKEQEKCLTCHHKFNNNDKKTNILSIDDVYSTSYDEIIKLDINNPEDPSGFECSTCHNNKTITNINNREAFHGQCIGCHEKEAKGPVLCGECHKR